ncbi:hypothetical protein F8388_026233 [Cannabis sativa]|uniref:NAC domain-containing protein n=1 Tax=Cannabis sativa TaxID=3483 RepID=A0A7J6E0T7_CANSA|nr:hypothetical protein F8388_026233 [Cannabis sativa]KAF4386508.1 hypothetical protein G4B88_006764 [Cannabis sativa]
MRNSFSRGICMSHAAMQRNDQAGIHDLPGLPAGVKFDPTDQELLQHLEGKVRVRKDGLVRHFFHRPSKAYTTGTRKRRKVHTDEEGGETRWHKTGKTRPVFVGGRVKGYKKILVLYTNYGKQRKPEKTNWVMHQYHLGNNEEEKEGELVVSKVFYQTQPRQCGSVIKDLLNPPKNNNNLRQNDESFVEYSCNIPNSFISFDHAAQNGGTTPEISVTHFGAGSFLNS